MSAPRDSAAAASCRALVAVAGAFAVADRARHLADRAQGLEGSTDRDARRARLDGGAGRAAAARAWAELDAGERRIPPRHVRAPIRHAQEALRLHRAARRCAPMSRARAIGCSRRRGSPTAASSSSIAALCRRTGRIRVTRADGQVAGERSRSSACCAGRSSRGWFTPPDDAAAERLVSCATSGDGGAQGLGRGGAVLHRAGGAGAARRTAAAGRADGRLPQRPSAIRAHLVRACGVLVVVFASGRAIAARLRHQRELSQVRRIPCRRPAALVH